MDSLIRNQPLSPGPGPRPGELSSAPGSPVAYFTMEVGIRNDMPTYSGGLGVLAGDMIRSAADLRVPMAAVTLLHRSGYFRQTLDVQGGQIEEPQPWPVSDFLEPLPERAEVVIEGRTVRLRAWRHLVRGADGFTVPVFFLDADLPENSDADRALTRFLYGGDASYRLSQEVILGIGGVRMLRALGYRQVARFHLNEGHAALAGLALLDEEAGAAGRAIFNLEDVDRVRRLCVFTTHTPVAAGHDQFPMDLVERILGDRVEFHTMPEVFCCEGRLNMTYLALNLSHFVNGVAKRHAEVSQLMFARHRIESITNGVHASTWASAPFAALFDRHIPGWRLDNFSLRYAAGIPCAEIRDAHREAKRRLLERVAGDAAARLAPDALTLGFARRATAYKRADLLFRDADRLRRIAAHAGPLQVIFAGKAHPRDTAGKDLIRRIFQEAERLRGVIPVVYLPDYDLELAGLLVSGVDVWLNTPEPPLEASGTSGMKAALNGVPSLSVLDGWWTEGCIEGITGWAIGGPGGPGAEAAPIPHEVSLYDKLEHVVMPLFYRDGEGFAERMRCAIALNGSFFNTQRMLQEYVLHAYWS